MSLIMSEKTRNNKTDAMFHIITRFDETFFQVIQHFFEFRAE